MSAHRELLLSVDTRNYRAGVIVASIVLFWLTDPSDRP